MNMKNIPDSSNYDEGKLFKVNLPFTKDDFLAGNGEGVWAIADDETFEKLESGSNLENLYVRIFNDSMYYKGLLSETILPIETRGDNRPVVPYEYLNENYKRISEEERLDLIRRISQNRCL